MSQHDFENKLDELSRKIKFLGVDLSKKESPIVERLNIARQRYAEGDKVKGCANACYVKFLAEDLELIKNEKSEEYKKIKKIIRSDLASQENCFGGRMEISMAALLAKKRIDFLKSETPDFLITNISGLGIECGSAHLELNRESPLKSIVYKVESIINQKGGKKYSVPKIILAVDVSNLVFHEGIDPSFAVMHDKDKSHPVLIKAIDNSNFVSLTYFSYSWVALDGSLKSGATLHHLYSRIDRTSIDAESKAFLDKHWPLGDLWIEARTGKHI